MSILILERDIRAIESEKPARESGSACMRKSEITFSLHLEFNIQGGHVKRVFS